jgi:nitrite reductase/ring-hydroxylating ferredoxin subunit
LKSAGFFGLLALFSPLRAWAERKVAIRLSKVPALKKSGAHLILRVLGREILFVRVDDNTIVAMNAYCSHRKSRLGYSAKTKQVVCPNHGSTFTIAGKVTKGPASENIKPVYWAKLDRAKKRILLKVP